MAFVAWMSACGDNLAGVAVDGYDDVAHDKACEYWVACGLVASRADCDLPNVGDFTLDARYVDAVLDGRVFWDPIGAYACLQSWTERGCDRTSQQFRVGCEPYTRGMLVDGETCMFDDECVSNECFNEFCIEACCAGVCSGSLAPQPSHAGEQCRTARCVDSWCDGSYCRAFVDDGGGCERDAECAYGLGCSDGTCQLLPERGERCTNRGPVGCRGAGDLCTAARDYRCLPVAMGAPCLDDVDCGGGSLYRCGPQLTCERRPLIPLGEPCGFGSALCADDGARCVFGTSSSTCELPNADGEPCTYAADCESRICNYSTGTCHTLEGCL